MASQGIRPVKSFDGYTCLITGAKSYVVPELGNTAPLISYFKTTINDHYKTNTGIIPYCYQLGWIDVSNCRNQSVQNRQT